MGVNEAEDNEEAADASPDWRRSHLVVFTSWVITFLPIGLPQASQTWGHAESVGVVRTMELREISGLAVNGHDPRYLWAHNDSGDGAQLYLIRRDGELVGKVRIELAGAYDWEDMARGPCAPGSARSCLYVGDIGDNKHVRPLAWVVQIEEPSPERVLDEGTTWLEPEHLWVFTYEDGAHDAEGLFVDPKTSLPHIVQKARRGPTRVLALGPREPGGKTSSKPTEVGRLDLSKEMSRASRLVTAADMREHPRRCIALRTYSQVLTSCGTETEDVAELLEGPWERTNPGAMLQSESLAFDPETSGILISSEGVLAPIVWLPDEGT